MNTPQVRLVYLPVGDDKAHAFLFGVQRLFQEPAPPKTHGKSIPFSVGFRVRECLVSGNCGTGDERLDRTKRIRQGVRRTSLWRPVTLA